MSAHDDLYARALALHTHDVIVIVVAVDLIGLARHEIEEIARTVQASAPMTQLVVAATHTHHGPDTLGLWSPDEMTRGIDLSYFAHLKQVIAATALQACQHLQPASLCVASTQVTGIARNARDPAITDEELSCLQFVDPETHRPLAPLLVYPCHPEVLWDDNPHISSDYLHSTRRTVEHATDAPCIGMVGALGGMMTPAMPGNRFEDAAQMGVILGGGDFDLRLLIVFIANILVVGFAFMYNDVEDAPGAPANHEHPRAAAWQMDFRQHLRADAGCLRRRAPGLRVARVERTPKVGND